LLPERIVFFINSSADEIRTAVVLFFLDKESFMEQQQNQEQSNSPLPFFLFIGVLVLSIILFIIKFIVL